MNTELPSLTWFFITIIVIACLLLHNKFNQKAVTKGPAFLTTVGIFGTFLGIAIGLMDFNANDIQNSVPKLIDGVKTACWVSAVGVGAALTIKLRDMLWGLPAASKSKFEGATIDDLARLLADVKQAICGNDDSTLVTQIKLHRQDSNDRMDKLSKSLSDFYEKVAENNSKALIEALKEVIKDFNAKINEQFGENFKQLNQAVEKILIWQEKYKEQMAEMIEQQSKSARNMVESSNSFEFIVTKADAYIKTAEGLNSMLVTAEEQKKTINESLRMLAQLVDSASKGMPKIEENINQIVRQLESGINQTNSTMQKTLVEAVQATNQELNKQINGLIDRTKEQVSILDVALQKELKDSLETFGKSLSALSQKFAEDYSPITDKLNRMLSNLGGAA